MCGALAINDPPASKMAQEKSSRSFTFTDSAVFCSVYPICSAIDMNRLLNTSSITGSQLVPMATRSGRATTRRRTRSPIWVISACHPGSTMVVAVASMISAGPSMRPPVGMVSRSKTGAVTGSPPMKASTAARGVTSPSLTACGIASTSKVRPMVSTEMVAAITPLPGITNPKRLR